MGENRGSHQFLNWWQQQSPGLLHLEWFDSLPLQKNNSTPVGVLSRYVRGNYTIAAVMMAIL
jgi:hypothetical protein